MWASQSLKTMTSSSSLRTSTSLFLSPSVSCLPPPTFPLLSTSVPDACHWLSVSGFFCPLSTDPEHIHISLAFNPPPPSALHLLLYFPFSWFQCVPCLHRPIHPPKDHNAWLFSLYTCTAVFSLAWLIIAPWRWKQLVLLKHSWMPDQRVSYPRWQ